MPRRSRKRYPPQGIDLSESMDLEELTRALEPTRKHWAGIPQEDRSNQAGAKLDAVSRLMPPDLSDPEAPEYFDSLMPSSIIEPSRTDRGGFHPFKGRITREEFDRLVRIPHQPESLSRLKPDRAEIEYVVTHHLMPEYHRHSRPLQWFFESAVDPVYGSPLTREAIVFEFLEWLYGQLMGTPDRVPDAGKMAAQLVAVANRALSERRAYFELKKRGAYDAVALAVVRSLTNWGPDEDDEDDIYYWISDQLDSLVGPEEYDPLSKPDLRALIERIAEMLEDNPRAGIGPYDVWELKAIFEPRELVVLEACARHWRDPREWPWNDVLRHTGLHQVMNEKMLRNTATEVRGKLEGRRDLRARLGIDPWFGELREVST